MMTARLIAISIICAATLLLGGWTPTPGPGDSELTLLMRRLFDEALAARTAILQGNEPIFRENAADILTAKASREEKTNNPHYHAAAKAYLEALDTLRAAPPAERITAFNQMVDACMGCHRKVCPGPTMRIQKLYIKS